MRIPKKVLICGQDFEVVRQKDLVDMGICMVEECTIKLRKGLNKEKRKEVFLHECLHAIDENTNMELGEDKVNTLGIHILALIKNNKLDFLH